MVDLELYRIFVAVSEEKNITKASEKLNISQPAVTKHIQNLENELQVKLFIRSNKGLELTEEGEKIYNEAKDCVKVLSNIYYKYGKNIQINLGSHATILNKLFANKLASFYQIYNKKSINVDIRIINEDTQDMISSLEEGNLDIVISKKTDIFDKEKIEYIHIGELHDILIKKKDTKIENKTYTIEDLKNEVIFTPRKTSMTVVNFLKKLNIDENELQLRHITYRTMVDLLENLDGIGLVTKEYVQDELKEEKICELKTDIKIDPIEYGIYYRKNEENKYIKRLIEILREG